MLQSTKRQLEISELRTQIRGWDVDAGDAEELGKLEKRHAALEVQFRTALREEGEIEQRTETVVDAETRELDGIRDKARVGNYLAAALEMRAADGVEREFNAALKIAPNKFPLELLAPLEVEQRAAIDGDPAASPRSWLDRLFATSAASRVGVTFSPVAPGISTHPVTTGGVSGAQRARTQSTTTTASTISVIEAKPKRAAVRTIFSAEDSLRMPGLESALTRDIRASLMDSVDKAVFSGDAGASGTEADITGLQTATNVIERTLSQAHKIKSSETLAEFAALIDGKHASSIEDLRVVSSVGANSLWMTTIPNSAVSNETLAQFLRASGLSWMVRADIDTNTANGDFGAFMGRGRGIEGAGVAAVWGAGELIRDPYTEADSGEVVLTLNYFWDLVIARPTQFARVKFVS